jgi:hypothetical protein
MLGRGGRRGLEPRNRDRPKRATRYWKWKPRLCNIAINISIVGNEISIGLSMQSLQLALPSLVFTPDSIYLLPSPFTLHLSDLSYILILFSYSILYWEIGCMCLNIVVVEVLDRQHFSSFTPITLLKFTDILQGDSFEGGPEFKIINHAILYRWKRNLASTYLNICGHNLITENAEIDFPPHGDTGWHDAPRPLTFQPAWQEGSQTEGNGANGAGSYRISAAKCTVLRSLVSIRKLLPDL